jgi:hypothetical protein
MKEDMMEVVTLSVGTLLKEKVVSGQKELDLLKHFVNLENNE